MSMRYWIGVDFRLQAADLCERQGDAEKMNALFVDVDRLLEKIPNEWPRRITGNPLSLLLSFSRNA